MTQVTLIKNNLDNIDLELLPVKTQTILTEEDIYALIEASEYSGLYINKRNITQAIKKLSQTLHGLPENEVGEKITVQVMERRDAKISIAISNDDMVATAEVTAALGGENINAKAIINAAQAVGIKKGFIKENIILLTNKAATEPAGSSVKYEIARGTPAINGKDAKIKPLVESADDRILKPQKRQDGSDSVDMKNLGDIICVKENQAIAQKIPLTQGTAGFTVMGHIIEPTPGNDIDIQAGAGTIINPNNENILLSTRVGLPKLIENGMEVDNVYQIKNVDVGTGHINFKGSVIISGDVCEGMEVIASGDITIGGFVESATLESGGDITIGGGIIGKKQEVTEGNADTIAMSAHLKAKGNIHAKYCQYATIECENLTIVNQIMHCLIRVKQDVWVGSPLSANGTIIAGKIKAGAMVQAGVIGASSGVTTAISFTDTTDRYKSQQKEISHASELETENGKKIEAAIAQLKALPKQKAQPKVLNKLFAQYRINIEKIMSFQDQIEAIDLLIQDYMSTVQVIVTEKLYHGVLFTIGDNKHKTQREQGPSKISYQEEKITIAPYIKERKS